MENTMYSQQLHTRARILLYVQANSICSNRVPWSVFKYILRNAMVSICMQKHSHMRLNFIYSQYIIDEICSKVNRKEVLSLIISFMRACHNAKWLI